MIGLLFPAGVVVGFLFAYFLMRGDYDRGWRLGHTIGRIDSAVARITRATHDESAPPDPKV